MQKHGQLHHFTYINLVLGVKVIILHTKLSYFFKALSSYTGFCFPSVRRFSWHWPPCHQPGTDVPCSEEQWQGRSCMQCTWAHWDSLGAAACTCLALLGIGALVSSGDPCAFALWFWIKLESKSTIFTDSSCMLWRNSVIKLQCMP